MDVIAPDGRHHSRAIAGHMRADNLSIALHDRGGLGAVEDLLDILAGPIASLNVHDLGADETNAIARLAIRLRDDVDQHDPRDNIRYLGGLDVLAAGKLAEWRFAREVIGKTTKSRMLVDLRDRLHQCIRS